MEAQPLAGRRDLVTDDSRARAPVHLATTALTEFWGSEGHLLLLGEWCRRPSNRAAWAARSVEVLDDVWRDPTRVHRAEQYCGDRVDALLVALMRALEEIHGERHDLRYWRILVGPWLFHYIETLYDRYTTLRAAFDRYPHLHSVVLDRSCYHTPSNWKEFTSLTTGDPYNLQLYSQVLAGFGMEFPARRVPVSPRPGCRPSHDSAVRTTARRLRARVLASLGNRRQVLLFGLGMPARDLCRLCFDLRLKAWPKETPPVQLGRQQPDWQQRTILAELEVERPDDFTRCVVETLPVNLPVAYLEGYPELCRVTAGVRTASPRVIVSAYGWKSDDAFKIIAADAAERGGTLIGVQHGGTSGLTRRSPMDAHIRAVADVYASWGWSGDRVVPLPHPGLCRLAREASRHRRLVVPGLFVASTFPRYVDKFRPVPLGSQVVRYLAWQTRFFKALPDAIRPHLTVRLHPHEFGWENRTRLQEEVGPLRFDTCRRSYRWLLERTALLIFDNPQTTFVQAVVHNRPSVLFFEPVLWEMAPAAAGVLASFRDAGVLCQDPETAAKLVADVFQDPQAWWNRATVQRARQLFLKQFVSLGDWRRPWRTHLREALDGVHRRYVNAAPDGAAVWVGEQSGG